MLQKKASATIEADASVGVAGFEPATTPTPKVCATGLRYTPIVTKILHELSFDTAGDGVSTKEEGKCCRRRTRPH